MRAARPSLAVLFRTYKACNIGIKMCPLRMGALHLASAGPGHAALHALDLGLKLLDDRVALLEVLVEAIPLGDELLLPLPEA
jgi:hypothetical protein